MIKSRRLNLNGGLKKLEIGTWNGLILSKSRSMNFSRMSLNQSLIKMRSMTLGTSTKTRKSLGILIKMKNLIQNR